MSDNYFTELASIDVSQKTEKKGRFSYLSWAYAWGEVKKLHPDASYTVYENADGLNYHTDGLTCWVKTGVTINGIEHIEYLPIMDARNCSIPKGKVTSCDVNKAIQRSITKACARHGLGLYIYAGEDLPDSGDAIVEKAEKSGVETEKLPTCSDCGCIIFHSNGRTSEQIANGTEKSYGRKLCWNCMAKEIMKGKKS